MPLTGLQYSKANSRKRYLSSKKVVPVWLINGWKDTVAVVSSAYVLEEITDVDIGL